MKKLFLIIVAMLGSVAHAQSPTYVLPQTVQQTLANNIVCTGSAQTFAITNLGQTKHTLSVTVGVNAQTFSGEIDGIDARGNVFRISDILSVAQGSGSVSGDGYFPQIQVSITCSPIAAHFTASYSGAWGTGPYNANVGNYLFAQIDKTIFASAITANSLSSTTQTPFGSSAGTIYFQYSGAITGGGSLTINCTSSGLLNANQNVILNYQLAAIVNLQTFYIPNTACPTVGISYSAGVGAGTFAAEYVFSLPGTALPNIDPCSLAQGAQSNNNSKVSTAVSVAGAATTQIVGNGSPPNQLYICGYHLSQATTAGTIQFIQGTGANCGTGTTNLSGAMPVTAAQPISYGNGGAYVLKTQTVAGITGANVCLVVTGAGGVTGVVTSVLSP